MRAAAALTVFLSAFLLFQVQPLIAKYLLPWFGGAPAVWTTCLLFFQVVLLAGYAYAHLLVSRFSPRAQAWIHAALLLAAAATLPIIPAARWKPLDPLNPTGRIIALLVLTVGVPFFALSATAPLLQAWVARAASAEERGASPYRLYALSNVASLLALLSFPFAVEPLLSRREAAWGWSGGFVLFAIACAYCAASASHVRSERIAPPSPRTRGEGGGEGQGAHDQDEPLDGATAVRPAVELFIDVEHRSPLSPTLSPEYRGEGDEAPTRLARFLWLALPACTSALLMGTTNTLTQDVAPVPFLWVLPLALYLLSFVLAFDHPRWYARRVMGPLMIAAAIAVMWTAFQPLERTSLVRQLAVYSAALFIVCLTCHGELHRLRPHPRRLTGYFLAIAAGGALGGAFVTLVAPRAFDSYMEFGLSLWASCALVLLILATDRESRLFAVRPPLPWLGLLSGLAGLTYFVWLTEPPPRDAVEVGRSRNFYGVLTVYEWQWNDDPRYPVRSLQHGRVMHGVQAVSPPELRRQPLGYYSPHTGLGQVMARTADRARRHIGVIGLGTGTVAALARPGDRVRFYEIDPDVVRVARSSFSYLADSPAEVEVVLGDARLSMEREAPQAFDVLVLDAFSGDAIPVHLLTREAFAVYRRHVRDDGLLAIHISNRHLNLRPVVAGAARELGMGVEFVSSERRPDGVGDLRATWAIVVASDAVPTTREADQVLWTDDRSDLLRVIQRRGSRD